MSEPLHIFISYAHADESFKNELTTMLALLRRQGTVKSWDDRQIDAGSDWRADIMGGMDRWRRVLAGQPCGIGSLKLRGLVVDTEQGEVLFGEVLASWVREME